MTDDEIEVVAEELAKISGLSSDRGREPGSRPRSHCGAGSSHNRA